MRDTARMLHLHPSTITRALKGKYVETPSGTYPLRLFFGKNISPEIIKLSILNIIEKDSCKNDEAIAQKLKNVGLCISRRTVNKYILIKEKRI